MRSSIHIVTIILLILLSAQLTSAQQRYLVNSYGDVIHIAPGKSAASEIQRQTHGKFKITNGESACTPQIAAGNPYWNFTEDSRFLHGHKDVIGVWFETPSSGTIDSVFVKTGNESSTQFPPGLILRIHRSNLYTGHAPGWGDYIAPPRLCWGYFDCTLDTDSGHAAAFAEDATNPAWRSTYQLSNADSLYHYGNRVDTSVRSFPPAGEEIWGDGGEWAIPIHNAAITSLDLSTPGRPSVEKGEPIFISLTVPGNHPANYVDLNTDPTRMTIAAADDGIGMGGYSDGIPDPAYRRNFHNFKFYEHPIWCGKPGWIARGDDNLFIWYVMSVTGDMPPTFISYDQLGHTLEQTGTRTVQANIEDCNYITSGPGSGVGVDSARLIYNVNGSPDNIVYMNHVGGTLYEATIPNFSCSNTVSYRLEAVDVNGNRSSTKTVTYRVLCTQTSITVADTNFTRSYTGKLTSDPAGARIDKAQWFVPHNKDAGSSYFNDGTAGPFAIGSFPFCGDTMHYAWIGVNGGIALSKTAADTIHVNANGYFSAFSLPGYIHRAALDTTTLYGVPRNFIAPLWTDLMIHDASYYYDAAFGSVYHKNDANYFIAEWDSLGCYLSTDNYTADGAIFRVVLNKADGSIECQYDNIGTHGIENSALVGMQADSSNTDEYHGFIMANQSGYPRELRPRNNWAIKFWPFFRFVVGDGWNMISLPGTLLPGVDFGQQSLHPGAGSQAFIYSDGYISRTTIQNGAGFWMKFIGTQMIGLPVTPLDSVDVALAKDWNMVGSVSKTAQTSSVTTTPPDEIAGSFFGYDAGYNAAETLVPGRGYWVKASAACTLHIQATPGSAPKQTATDDLTKLNAITLRGGNGAQTLYIGDQSLIKRSYELPPAPPAGIFDARFASQQMVETYPTTMQPGKEYRYAINLQSASYPVIVQWNISKQPEGRTLILTDGGSGTIINSPMTGTGSLRITSAAVKSLVVKLSESVPALPKEFALGRNYPNPFNPTTRFVVEMPKSVDVEVAVYDILGQRIATLLSGQQAAGYHTVEWNGTNSAGLSVPSGTYFIRMVSESYTKVQKAMLMK